MTCEIDFLGIESIIFRYEEAGSKDSTNHSIFICPLEGGPLRFLHKVFEARATRPVQELQNLLRFPPPDDYLAFMSRCNGVTLFDNTLFIFGLGSETSRGTHLQDQGPILLRDQLEISDALYGTSYPWRRIGSVVGYSLSFGLEICRAGEARIRDTGGTARHFGSFRELLFSIATLLDGFVDERGFRDGVQEAMDNVLLRFVTQI